LRGNLATRMATKKKTKKNRTKSQRTASRKVAPMKKAVKKNVLDEYLDKRLVRERIIPVWSVSGTRSLAWRITPEKLSLDEFRGRGSCL
jgi:hypothetical protein